MAVTKKIVLFFLLVITSWLIFNASQMQSQRSQLEIAKNANQNFIRDSFLSSVTDYRNDMFSILGRVNQAYSARDLFNDSKVSKVDIASLDSMLQGSKVDFIYLFGVDGAARFARQYNYYQDKTSNVIQGESGFLTRVYEEVDGAESLVFGIAQIASEPVYLAATPVVEWNQKDNLFITKGYLVTGSYLSTILSHVSSTLDITINYTISPAHITAQEVNQLIGEEGVTLASMETLAGNILWLKLSPVNNASQFTTASVMGWGWWSALIVAVIGLGWLLLYRPTVGRINEIVSRLDDIQKTRNYSTRLPLRKNDKDEFNLLCTKINGVLSTLEYANRLVAKTSEVTTGIIDEVMQSSQGSNVVQDVSLSVITPKERLTIVSRLSLAIEKEILHVVFQPQYETVNQVVTGVEALARWNDDELGKVPPCQFIPLAEASGLMAPLGEVLMKQACIKAKSWQNAGFKPIPVAVKLSKSQFFDKRLISIVAAALGSSKLAPRYLELSIKEGVLVEDLSYSEEIMQTLSNIGVQLVVEDFGTGDNSMQILKQLPVNRLKLHPSFVTDVAENKRDASLVEGIVNLAHSMDMSVVASGVETEEQLEVLRRNGSDALQGFYLGYPVSSEQLIPLLSRIEVPRLVVGKK